MAVSLLLSARSGDCYAIMNKASDTMRANTLLANTFRYVYLPNVLGIMVWAQHKAYKHRHRRSALLLYVLGFHPAKAAQLRRLYFTNIS